MVKKAKYAFLLLEIVFAIVSVILQDMEIDWPLAQLIAPGYTAANKGYQLLRTSHKLERQDDGFKEISELISGEISSIALRDIVRIDYAGGAVIDIPDFPSEDEVGPSISIVVVLQNDPPVGVKIRNPKETILEHFYNEPVERASIILLWLLIIIGFTLFILEVIPDLKSNNKTV